MQQLIAIALENNRDLRVAALNIEQAQAQYRVQHAALFPQISANGGGAFESIPANSTFAFSGASAGAAGAATIPTRSDSIYFRSFNAGSASPITNSTCSAGCAACRAKPSSNISVRPRPGAARRSA
ncbi:MAG: TolC family protein [Aliidongia sp.]